MKIAYQKQPWHVSVKIGRDNIAMRNNVMIMLSQNEIAKLILYQDFVPY